jgi:arabinan endo-1,5-alpha-L-arabinosidase
MKIKRLLPVVLIFMVCLMNGCASGGEKSMDEIKKGVIASGVSVHDPSVIKAVGKYYIFGSHMEAAVSSDLKEWKSVASGVNADNKLFDNLFDEERKAFSYVGQNNEGGYSVWAPDVVYNKKMGKYVMYFCTTSSFVKSNICFAVADQVEGPYHYVDTILYSGFTRKTAVQTDFLKFKSKAEMLKDYAASEYDHSYWPNCIDPTVFYDKEGKLWMTYGSWSGGIFLLEINEETGYPIHPEDNKETETDSYFGKKLLGGFHNSIEGPYILYDMSSDYYYLFVSYGSLVSKGGYQIRVFRSKEVNGTYVDAKGQSMGAVIDHSEYGVKLMGNYTLPSLSETYLSPGHNSAFIDDDGKMYVVYHQRFDDKGEYHEPRVHQLFVNEQGWPVAAPFATMGESLTENGYKSKEVTGTYYLVNHGSDISSNIPSTLTIILEKNGTISGSIEGTWSMKKESPYMELSYEGETYKGIFLQMEDEAGNPVMTFSTVGDNNQCVWGVHYQ